MGCDTITTVAANVERIVLARRWSREIAEAETGLGPWFWDALGCGKEFLTLSSIEQLAVRLDVTVSELLRPGLARPHGSCGTRYAGA